MRTLRHDEFNFPSEFFSSSDKADPKLQLWRDVYRTALEDCGFRYLKLTTPDDSKRGLYEVQAIFHPVNLIQIGKSGSGKARIGLPFHNYGTGCSLEIACAALAQSVLMSSEFGAALTLRTLEFMGGV